MSIAPACRLFGLIAQDVPRAVIFRRGPSDHVQLLSWNLLTDELQEGQWFKGRIYERRCDLSPNGDYLVYFAANWSKTYGTWTAISRPPYFRALALWPKGDAWGGGGLFSDNFRLGLNHADVDALASGFSIPKKLKVEPLGEWSGGGEDNPIYAERLSRDGWSQTQEGVAKEHSLEAPIWITYEPPEIWTKQVSQDSSLLAMYQLGVKQLNGPWNVLRFSVKRNGEEVDLGECDWADFDHHGDLLFSKGGELFRWSASDPAPRLIADLTTNRFQGIAPSDAALQW